VPPGFVLRRFARRNLLATLTTLVFAGVATLVLVQVDRVYYSQAKYEAITPFIEDLRYLAGPGWDGLVQSAGEWQEPRDRGPGWSPEMETRVLETMRARADRFLDDNPMALAVSVLDTQRAVVFEARRPERMKLQNDFGNCLLIRRWERTLTRGQFMGPTRERRRAIAIKFTTPRDNPEVEALTREWRAYAGLILLGLAGTYGLLMWRVILPTRNVLSALDKGSAVGSPFLDKPGTLLEIYYNNLARDATLSVYSTHLRSLAADDAAADPDEIPAIAARLLRELFPVPHSGVVALRRADRDSAWKIDEAGSSLDALDEQTASDARRVPFVEAVVGPGGAERGMVAEAIHETDAHRAILVVPLRGRLAGNSAWWSDVLRAAASEARFAVRIAEQRRRVILQEQSKANISLSRNLGHDLTNIIATMKLDLMTAKSLLDMPSEKVYASEQKQRLFRESLESVLSSTRFLQETVNLYRSFTYLSRPKFERVVLSDLVEDVARLFRLSTSRSIAVRAEADRSLPGIVVEPRLLKLALFNLLSNASDAIKLASSADRPNGEIVLRTGPGRAEGTQQIAVEDSGSGIRDRDGRLLDQTEIDRVFQLGYTTKEQGTGEGLGLSWVSQIVREFHGGELVARNRSEGGASFSIVLSAAVTESFAEGSRDEPGAAQ